MYRSLQEKNVMSSVSSSLFSSLIQVVKKVTAVV